MWGRVILGAVIVTLTILWVVAIWFLLLEPRTFLQKWQGGLWNNTNWPVPSTMQKRQRIHNRLSCFFVLSVGDAYAIRALALNRSIPLPDCARCGGASRADVLEAQGLDLAGCGCDY
jgi:hypothetical protein